MRYSNENLIKAFNGGAIKGESFTGNIYIVGNKLYNYRTIIAVRANGNIFLNSTKYSRTTSKIQSMIRRFCNVECECCEQNLYNLVKLIEQNPELA